MLAASRGDPLTKKQRDAIEAGLRRAAEICAGHGAVLTDLRRAVLGLVLQAATPLTAYQLLDRLKESRKGAAPPTIYRALDFLVEQGLVHKIERLNAFVACSDHGEHDHAAQFLICRQCGSVAEIEDRGVTRALRQAAVREGFHPAHAMVELDGTCAACTQAAD